MKPIAEQTTKTPSEAEAVVPHKEVQLFNPWDEHFSRDYKAPIHKFDF